MSFLHTIKAGASFSSILLLSSLLISSVSGAQPSNKSFTIKQVGGVPMIAIDDEPVRSRVFFGLMGSAPIIANTQWQTFENDFTAIEDSQGEGTIHFRFGSLPGVIALDNISIIEKSTGRQVAGPFTFEQDSDYTANFETFHEHFHDTEIAHVKIQNGIGPDKSRALVIRINEYDQDLKPDFHLYHIRNLTLYKDVVYTVKFDVRSTTQRSLAVNLYRPASPAFIKIGSVGRDIFASQIKLAAKAGVNFVSFNPITPVWPHVDGTYDWTTLDAACDAALKANPDALLIPRLRLNASKEWLEAHPDAKAIWMKAGADHDGQGWDWATPASPEYRKTACEALTAAIRHLEEKYGSSIAGYHPAGQNTSEWFTPNTWTEGYPGFSTADRNAFRQWLRKRYSDVAALRQAWNDPKVTFDSAVVPSAEERDASRETPIVESQNLLDFNAYWQSTMTELICELAHTIKQETNGKKLSVFFYGYAYEFSTVRKGPAASAHYGLRDLLNCPDVDIICSPISYSERQLGGGCSCMLNAESVTAAGKLYIYEDDSRTFLAHAVGADLSSTTNLADSTNVLLRNSGETALRNFGTWLMDLGGVGWYDSPELWEASASLEKLDRYFIEHPTPYAPEVGLFLSEKAMLKMSSGTFSGAVSTSRRSANLLGAPYAQFDLDDLLSGKIPAPKLCVILNSETLDEATRAQIETQVAKTNAHILWASQAGFDAHQLRKAASEAGVWIYTDLWCNVWANGPFVLLHAPCDGDYTFKAPLGQKKIYDYFNNELLSEEGTLKLPMKMGDTRILRLE